MIIEVLFGEICNLYGDPQNAVYLSQTMPEAEIIHTSLDSVPFFADNRPDMILIGSMSDNMHSSVVEKLKPYKQRLVELINDNVVFLVTGSACEERAFTTTLLKPLLRLKASTLPLFTSDISSRRTAA